MNKFKRRQLSVALLALVLVAGATAFGFRSEIRSAIEQLAGNDYSGTGESELQFVIVAGDTGESIANELVASGVVKDFRLTYRLILERNQIFYPGTYQLKTKMSSLNALNALSDPSKIIANRVVIKEGFRLSNVFKALASATKISETEFAKVATQLELFDLPAGAPSLEGYLFPATYSFDPGASAEDILVTMRNRMQKEVADLKIPASKVHEVLTLASIVQKEARLTEDFFKAARTFQNRLDIGMKLQSDATVSYGVGGSTVSTSAADRAAENGYNTYRYEGLPIGPISAPGRVAIEAALNPAQGKWLYFCTVNLETGETWFSETYAEHQEAVRVWRAWMKENPGYE